MSHAVCARGPKCPRAGETCSPQEIKARGLCRQCYNYFYRKGILSRAGVLKRLLSPWKSGETYELVRLRTAGFSLKEIARLIGRSYGSVAHRSARMGLRPRSQAMKG